jgi:ribosomal protein S18 acetylase RimI-like enzyme
VGVDAEGPRAGIVIQPLEPGHLDEYLQFFDTRAFTDNPRWADCYCYYPLHDPREKDWAERTGLENREAVSGCILSGRSQGYLAYRDGEVIGWCSAGPRSLYPMLRDEPRPVADSTGAIFCFIVAPEHRGQGVASALLDAACVGLQARGLTVAQARPLKEPSSAPNERGPLPMYLKAGFVVVNEYPDGTVLVQKRLD